MKTINSNGTYYTLMNSNREHRKKVHHKYQQLVTALTKCTCA